MKSAHRRFRIAAFPKFACDGNYLSELLRCNMRVKRAKSEIWPGTYKAQKNHVLREEFLDGLRVIANSKRNTYYA